jgi:capsular polysaccharide biosynthesis protein
MPWLDDVKYNVDHHFITATNENQSRMIAIEVVTDNPYDAAIIANDCVDILDNLSMVVYGEDLVQVVEVAVPVLKPDFPERKLVVPLGFGFGFLVGILVVYLRWFFAGGKEILEIRRRENANQE